MTNCTLNRKVKKRSIHINFNGGDVSGIGGVELLRAADDRLGLCKAASRLLPDPRNPTAITHQWEALFRQRVYGIAAGFADLNDHQQLRHDAALQSAVGVLEPMGSAATLCRVEAVASQLSPQDARKMVFQMHELMLQQFIDSYEQPPKSLVLDFDGTDNRVYGEQEGRSFSSHYGGYAFLPLYVYCGNHLLVSYLRPVSRTDSYHSAAVLSLLVKGLRKYWPEVNIVFRGDAGFYRPLLLSWCERHDVRYIIGYRSNEVLLRECQTTINTLDSGWHWLEHYDVDLPSIRHFLDIDYQAGSWRHSRRIVAKVERNGIGANQRFIVTDLPGDAEQLYSQVYCERGTMENRHKELQMGLFADRTSCSAWWSNQLRVLFSSLAYVLWQSIRQIGLAGTTLAKAQVWTLRQRLINIGAVVLRNTRRIELRLSSASLEKSNFLLALQRLQPT